MHQLPEPSGRSKEFLPSPPIRKTLPASYSEISSSAAPNLSAEAQEAGFLLEYWRMLRRKKGTLTCIAAIGTVGGFLVTVPQTPVYQAKTSLEIMGLNQNFLNVKEASPINEGGTSPDLMDIQTQVTILRSEALTDRVLAKLGNGPAGGIQEGRIPAWRKLLQLPDPGPLSSQEQALDYVKKHFEVSARPNTRVVQVSADSTDPRLATEFANTLANEFIEQNLEARVNTTERTGNFLSKQLEDMRVRLERSESQLQEYARAAGLLFVAEDKSNVSQDKLLQVQKDLSASRTDRIAKQSRWEMANTSPAEALPDILNDPTLRDYQTKLTDLERQSAELRQTFTPEHAKVKRIQAQITSLQSALARARSDILKRIKNEYDEAQRREKLLEADYISQRGIVTGEGEKAIQYNILKREVDSNRQLYDAMLQQMKQATLASALRASNIRVVDPAKVPKRPYRPDVFLSSGLGLFAGMFLGVAFVILQERSDRSIQAPGETAVYLNIPELGIVPSDNAPKVRIRIAAGSGVEDPAEPSNVPALRDRIELATWNRKPSMMAESFRAALVSILFSGENGSRPRVMVITKRVAELLLLALQNGRTKYVAVRFGNVLGSNGSVIPIFKKQIAAGGPLTVTHPEMRRFFMTIPEACQLVLEAGAIGEGGQICVLDMGKPVKIVDLATNLILLSGLRPEEDIKIEFTGMRPGEKLYEEVSTLLEDTVPTAHEKIRIFLGSGSSRCDILMWLDALKEICEARDVGRLIVALKETVLDYSPSAHLLKRVVETRSHATAAMRYADAR